MGNKKDFDSRVRWKENMAMILVRKRSAVMRGLSTFLRKPFFNLILFYLQTTN